MKLVYGVGILLFLGCGDSEPVAPQTGTPTAPPAQATPAQVRPEPRPATAPTPSTPAVAQPTREERKLSEFREKVAEYLDEARAGAKLLTLGPSFAEVTKKSQQITDLYTHLPDVPKGIADWETVDERLKNINGTFAVAQAFVKVRNEAADLNSPDLVKEAQANIEDLVMQAKNFCDEIDALVFPEN